MPFVEIVRRAEDDWVKISRKSISIAQNLRLKHFEGKRIRIFLDEENMLLGLKPAEKGYKLYDERFTCRQLPVIIPRNRFNAEWSDEENILIVDLNNPV